MKFASSNQWTALALLFGSLILGCSRAPQTQKELALHVWKSPASTLEQRAEAVSNLFVPGTPMSEVKSVLGRQGEWTRKYGLTGSLLDTNGFGSTKWEDEWSLDYQFSNGGVTILFKATNIDWEVCQFIRAAPFRTLTVIPSTNQP